MKATDKIQDPPPSLHSRNRRHPQKPHLCWRCKLVVWLLWWWGLECYRSKSQIMFGFEVCMYGVCTGQCMCHGAHIGQLGVSVVASLFVWDRVTFLFTALYGRLNGSEIFRDSNGFAPYFPKRSVLELQMHMLLILHGFWGSECRVQAYTANIYSLRHHSYTWHPCDYQTKPLEHILSIPQMFANLRMPSHSL